MRGLSLSAGKPANSPSSGSEQRRVRRGVFLLEDKRKEGVGGNVEGGLRLGGERAPRPPPPPSPPLSSFEATPRWWLEARTHTVGMHHMSRCAVGRSVGG